MAANSLSILLMCEFSYFCFLFPLYLFFFDVDLFCKESTIDGDQNIKFHLCKLTDIGSLSLMTCMSETVIGGAD